jgi:glutathione S-transferase
MSELKLVIGNRNYSSWSLRAWLALRKSGAVFDTEVIPLDTPEFRERIPGYSPTGRVPVLWHNGHRIWDSLAIGEYANEQFAGGSLWPSDPPSRGLGRAMAAEMHSGFADLRSKMPMNCRASQRRVPVDGALQADIDRVWEAWSFALSRHRDSGPWLLGRYSLVDAMFAPVVLRFQTYGVEPPAKIRPYCTMVLEDPDLRDWVAAALLEDWVIEQDEAGESPEKSN